MSNLTTQKKKETLKHALTEYLSHGVFIAIAYIIYFRLPYFQNLLQKDAKSIINYIIVAYATVGLIYFILRDFLKPEIYLRSENKSTIVLSFFSDLVFMRKIHFNEKIRVALFSIILKFFYFPLMLSFTVGNFSSAKFFWQYFTGGHVTGQIFLDWVYFLTFNVILVVDTVIFTFGYAIEAKWLKNEIKSVDPHISGWFFALICYPPFNGVVNLATQNIEVSKANILSDPALISAFRITSLIFYLIYVWASIALMTKASNLTNRGIVARGPYKYVRHPAYAAKNIAWWLEQIPYLVSWGGVIVLLMWNSIYVIRALTEERHLLRDPDYQKYVQKVRFRFIPGLI